MKRTLTAVSLAGALAGLSSAPGAPLPVGTISENVGYSQATDFSGFNFETLTQRHIADHSGKVLVIVFATPW